MKKQNNTPNPQDKRVAIWNKIKLVWNDYKESFCLKLIKIEFFTVRVHE